MGTTVVESKEPVKTQEERVKEITEKLEQSIKELFESKKYADYLKMMSKLHQYSFNNSMLIAMQKPDATMVAGFTSWEANFHRHVKKGESGIKILAPSPYKITKDIVKTDENQKVIFDKDGRPVFDRVEVTIPAYKVTTVFDVSQTYGEPIPELATNLTEDVKDYDRFLNAIREVSPVPIEIQSIDSAANGYYDLVDKKIVIKESNSQSQILKTAIHELSHAKLHDKETGTEGNIDRRTKEVQAESIAYTVCCHYGLDTSDYSFGYIAGWSSDKDLDELKRSMNTIRSTASEIIRGIDASLIRARQEEKIETLAIDIDRFSKDYDHYDYVDRVEDPEKHREEIKTDLRSGNVEHMQQWFKSVIEDSEPTDEYYNQAIDIARRIGEHAKERPKEHVAEKTAAVNEAVEHKAVVKHHHR